MTLRILHVATRHRVGGAERNLLHTVARELERGFEVHVAVGTEDLEYDFPTEARLHPVPELVREVSPRADHRALDRLRVIIEAHRFDVVQTHQSKAGAVGRAAARGRVPLIVHTVHMASFGVAYGRARSACFWALERWAARFTNRFVFVGVELARRYLAAGVGASDRCAVVRSPIPELEALLALREAPAAARTPARAAVGLADGPQVLLMVGALDRRKRHELAFEALAPLLKRGETTLLVAGQGPERPVLERLCRRLGITHSVRWLGFVRDVKPLYAAANLVVQTSTLEGVSQVVVQAVAAGLPVVATQVDGLREVADDPRQLSVVPADGRGLLRAVQTMLAVPAAFAPAPREAVLPWEPRSVDRQLDQLHEWMTLRLAGARASSGSRGTTPARLAAAPATGEPAIR